MRADLVDRYITNVPQNVKELLLITSILDPREGFKDLGFLSEADSVFPVQWKQFGKGAFERTFNIHYSPLSQSSASGSDVPVRSTSSVVSELQAQVRSQYFVPRTKEVGVSFSSFFGKKARCFCKDGSV